MALVRNAYTAKHAQPREIRNLPLGARQDKDKSPLAEGKGGESSPHASARGLYPGHCPRGRDRAGGDIPEPICRAGLRASSSKARTEPGSGLADPVTLAKSALCYKGRREWSHASRAA
jgi:hypothetical protein